MRVMLSVTSFKIGENSFTGILPESSLREVTGFYVYCNHFAGALPDGGMRAMQAVIQFQIQKNVFTGALSNVAFRAMTDFEVDRNRFTGSLPDRGMWAMRALEVLVTYENRLAEMLPENIFIKAMSQLYINDNFFAGTVAESLPCPSNPNPKLRPPKTLFGSHSPRTLPAALSRLSHTYSLALHSNYFEGLCNTHGCNIPLGQKSLQTDL
eukprot:5018573-Amphidinium_carterae.1